ncbi:hypothetical protein K8I28_07825 [bacterium]|nr:hypothetical protein [bacterium]
MNIAVYVTGHGFGHLTRSMEVIRFLNKIAPECDIHIRAPYTSNQIKDALGFTPSSIENVRLEIGLIQKDSLLSDFAASIQHLEHYYGSQGDRAVEAEARWIEKARIDAAFIDISPRAFDACDLAGIPAFGCTNFSWDWIWRELGRSDSRFLPFADKAAKAYGTSACLFRTVMDGDLTAFPVIEDVPLIARISTLEKSDIRWKLSIPSDKLVVILSYGGEGLAGAELPERSLYEDFYFITTEPMHNPGIPFHHMTDAEIRARGLRYCDLVHAADIVMSKPGYSTVAESVANQSAFIYSERSSFAEYPIIVDYIENNLPNRFLPSEQLLSGKWGEVLYSLQKSFPFDFSDVDIHGAEHVAGRFWERLKSR